MKINSQEKKTITNDKEGTTTEEQLKMCQGKNCKLRQGRHNRKKEMKVENRQDKEKMKIEKTRKSRKS